MARTTDASELDPFARLPDELLEKIFVSLGSSPPLTPTNHVRLGPHSMYFDYSVQQVLLGQMHTEMVRVALVCRRFYHIIKAKQFWEQLCRREHVLLPNQHFPAEFTAFETLYVSNPFHPSFNLLEESQWRKSRSARSQIERIPIGCDRLYDEFNRLSPCRVTSHMSARFIQRDVQLLATDPSSAEVRRFPSRKKALTSRFKIVQLRPLIEFSVCVAARADCGSRYALKLVFSDGHVWTRKHVFPQWTEGRWYRISYRYGQYEEFPSTVTVSLTGQDTQFWAGFFGVKFAQARLRLVLRTGDNGANEASVTVIEPKADEEPIDESELGPLEDNISVDSDSKVH